MEETHSAYWILSIDFVQSKYCQAFSGYLVTFHLTYWTPYLTYFRHVSLLAQLNKDQSLVQPGKKNN